MAEVHGAALPLLLCGFMIVSLLALMNVSPSHAKPRMPMSAVTPDWHVLLFGTSAAGAFATARISAPTVIITIAMEIGIVITVESAPLPGSVRSAGKIP